MNENPHTILYVDDDSANRTLVRKILVSEGFNVIEAEDGISGIDITIKEHPDLILMDMNMPGLDGYEASTRIKALPDFKNTPIVAVTANALQGDKERSLIAGCEGYIVKPIDPDTICSDIKKYIQGKKEQVETDDRDAYLQEYSNKLVERLEEKVRSLSIALEKSEQANNAKTNFLSIISHELRTPLHAIINLPEIFKKKFAENLIEEQGGILDDISENGKKLLSLINQILLYTQLEASNVKLSSSLTILHDIIQQVYTEYHSLAEDKGLNLMLQCSEDLPFINVDVDYLKQALSELVKNAIKFTKQGGIDLSCKLTDFNDALIPQNISKLIDHNKNYAMVSVIDSGIGIAEEKLEFIFADFSQSEDAMTRNYSGIGMGLTIAQRLIELHEGYIWASNNTTDGSSFYFIIPVAAEN